MSSTYSMYCRVTSAIGMLRMSRLWRRIRYRSRSSGPSKASRKHLERVGRDVEIPGQLEHRFTGHEREGHLSLSGRFSDVQTSLLH